MTYQCSMTWPNFPCAKLLNTLIANTHMVWMDTYLVSLAGYKLI